MHRQSSNRVEHLLVAGIELGKFIEDKFFDESG